MKITFETNSGTFVAFLTADSQIVIYTGDDETPIAVIAPTVKRRPAIDISADGVARAVRNWLEANHARLEIESVMARLTPPGNI